MTSPMGTGFHEIAERVWLARYAWFDVNVTLVGGDDGLLVVDTNASAGAARQVIDDVRRLGAGDVTGAVNTHEHFDHTFGNADLPHGVRRRPDPRPRERPRRAAREWGTRRSSSATRSPRASPHRDDVLGTEIVLPDHTFSSAKVLDLGDRLGGAGPPRSRPHRR